MRALDRPTGTVVHPPAVAGTVVLHSLAIAGTVVLHPLAVAGTVPHPLGAAGAGVAIRLPRTRSAADQHPLADAGAVCQPIFNTRSQLATLCLITSTSSSNG